MKSTWTRDTTNPSIVVAKLLFASFLLGVLLPLWGCNKLLNETGINILSSFSVSPEVITMDINDSETLTISPGNQLYTFNSTDEEVVVVNAAGVITAKSVGTAKISVWVDGDPLFMEVVSVTVTD